jgi:endogenous inhibitor of DNA gyrase (YacG/DUF329 family)
MPAETPPAPARRCPVCGKPVVQGHRPFCSARCKDVDLHRWLSGAYAIPAAATDADDDERPMPMTDRSRPDEDA